MTRATEPVDRSGEPAKVRYKDWKPGGAWPADVPKLVRNAQVGRTYRTAASQPGAVIFYNGHRVRPNETFTLRHPAHYSSSTMASAGEGAADDLARRFAEAGQVERLPAQSRHRPMSSAKLWSRPRGTLEKEIQQHTGPGVRVSQPSRASVTTPPSNARSGHAATDYDPYDNDRSAP